MMNLVDSSLWVDYFRQKTPVTVKEQIDQIINNPEVVTCEPILFEILRAAPKADIPALKSFFDTLPLLKTPPFLWKEATALGQACFASGFLAPSIDLLIAQVCLHHNAVLTTFDEHFQRIARVCHLRVNWVARGGSNRLFRN